MKLIPNLDLLGLPINYHIDKIMAKAHNGDIIILPLEFNYYSNNAPTKGYWIC
ncbi:hypothetical protein [Helicobacter typhlonius]|uniref:hypothetical protein n=1 Tax=Helicobacter typhlonius TaxID=76936 RepID=UPI002FDF45AF